MKLSIALLQAAVVVSAAQQAHHHGHQHLHQEKREPQAPAGYESVDVPTQVVYVLNGHPISETEVQQGINNGTLVFADGSLSDAPPSYEEPPPSYGPPPSSSSSSTSTSTSTSSSSTSSSSSSSTRISTSTPAPTTSVSKPTPTPKASTPPPSPPGPPPKPSPPGYGSGGGSGVDADFPDGTLSCEHFPSEYGPIPVEWTGLGGWTGVQCPGAGSDSTGFTNIETVTPGGTCREGAYCSYACPPGYTKTQWPLLQGMTGQSVGGVLCQNGKLHLTNPDLSKKLCMKGTDKVQVLVKNKLPKNVAVCGTDYPGLESETIPTDVGPGETKNLTCPDAEKAYKWQGRSTSAQYYVNPAGVPVEKACCWGTPDNPWGNFAPMNLGVGYSNGAAWLSIFQNAPTTNAKLEFTVEIVGDTLSGSCKYSDGQYCSGTSCSPVTGCTVRGSLGLLQPNLY